MEKIIKILEDAQDKLSSRECVISLCAKDVSDYERGIIQGRIDMLGYIMQELSSTDEADTL